MYTTSISGLNSTALAGLGIGFAFFIFIVIIAMFVMAILAYIFQSLGFRLNMFQPYIQKICAK